MTPQPTRNYLGRLLINTGLVFWIGLSGLAYVLGDGLDTVGPFPGVLYHYPDWPSPKTPDRCLEAVLHHDSRRRASLIQGPAYFGAYGALIMAVGFVLRFGGARQEPANQPPAHGLSRELRILALIFAVTAIGFGLRHGIADLYGSLSAKGMRIQTEGLGRTVWQARRLGLFGACTTAAAIATPFALVGTILLCLARLAQPHSTAASEVQRA